ncbi:GroES-like protein [Eremomyces bilateralis CBS 781.70]|uniref:GroES-like protein n=1 Tax=Eremomyces bilateralis CBS 781.70 TaxID=1392243 RepID=A0A6G1GC33_9PEZI|nr:GroES-like protein [Eremomyces bilateralis CBS 781.70]KAF1815647.1 GroES-like protein [Eremomyces bilateralis CBS 781.70]
MYEAVKQSVLESIKEIQQALTVARRGEYALRDDYPVPEIRDDNEVMIRNHAVGLNPIDWKSVEYNFCLPSFPWITGRESSGTVAKVGKNVHHVKPGDRVWTSTYYRDVRAGCFQEYIIVPQHTVLPIPADLSFEQAACLGVGALTAAMALWKWMDVPMPDPDPNPKSPESSEHSLGTETPHSLDSGYYSVSPASSRPGVGEWFLIWGGSTVTGQFATQIAIHSGLRVITVCSGRTAALSTSLGADHVVVRDDRTAEEIVEEIRAVTSGRLSRVIDLVGPKTAGLCLQTCRATEESKGETPRVRFAPLAMMANDEEIPEHVQVETVEMKRFVLDEEAAIYAQKLNELINCSSLRLPDLEVLEGGLSQVERGLEILKKGKTRGKRMVVRLRNI